MADFKVYGVKEVAALLEVSDKAIYSLIKSGKLKAVKVGRSWKVSEDNLKCYLNGDAEN